MLLIGRDTPDVLYLGYLPGYPNIYSKLKEMYTNGYEVIDYLLNDLPTFIRWGSSAYTWKVDKYDQYTLEDAIKNTFPGYCGNGVRYPVFIAKDRVFYYCDSPDFVLIPCDGGSK